MSKRVYAAISDPAKALFLLALATVIASGQPAAASRRAPGTAGADPSDPAPASTSSAPRLLVAGDDTRSPGFTAASNDLGPYGVHYGSWGTRGGATLGEGNGVRGGILGGAGTALANNYPWGAYGNVGLEGYFILGLGADMDVALGARIPFWPFGIAPGANLRIRFIGGGSFQLALDASAYFAILFAPRFAFIFSLEPGLMASYFVKDSLEVFFGLVVPVGFGVQALPGTTAALFTVGWDMRGGIAYTFKTINLGIYGQLDLVPNLWLVGAAPVAGNFACGMSAGVQWRF